LFHPAREGVKENGLGLSAPLKNDRNRQKVRQSQAKKSHSAVSVAIYVSPEAAGPPPYDKITRINNGIGHFFGRHTHCSIDIENPTTAMFSDR
jgi:hypothetical protein